MSQESRLKLKVISILILIVSCILLSFIYMFLRFLPVFFNLFDTYVYEGYSFFIPFLPYISIVPETHFTIPFTFGHLVDIIILHNISVYIETGIYHYIQIAFFNQDLLIFFNLDSHLLGSCEMLYVLSLDTNTIHDQKDEQTLPLDCNYVDFIDNIIINARNQNAYNYLRRIWNKNSKDHMKLFQRKVARNKLTINKRDFQISHFNNHYPHYQLCNITHSNEPFHRGVD